MLVNNYGVAQESIFILRNFLDRTQLSQASSMAIEQMYPSNVVPHALPRASNDLQIMLKSHKSLFVSRSRAKLTGIFLDIACDLFGFDRDKIWFQIRKVINKIRTEHLNHYKYVKKTAMVSQTMATISDDITPE